MAEQQPATAQQVTLLLARARNGDRLATRELFPLVYEELRRLADHYLSDEGRLQTLQATALVHEAFLRLVGPGETSWENRRHFFGAAAKAIRRILTDHARARSRAKRGSGVRPLALEEDVAVAGLDFDILALDEALDRLSELDPRKAELVELRFFGGMSVEEIGEALGVSSSTVAREWRFVRSWLYRELVDGR